MKIKGTFILRKIMDDVVAIPIGATALAFNGMIVLNPVGETIWSCLESETDLETIVRAITDRFDVTGEEAAADAAEFLEGLQKAGFLEETEII